MRTVGIISALAFVGTVWLANYLVQHYGAVSVGFGLQAPAGVWAAGLAFSLRDTTHHLLGRAWVIAAIVAGSLLSYIVSDAVTIPGGVISLALASGIAFLVSEFADLSVYEPIRRRGWLPAVLASNVVGLVADSILFLWLAFGSLTFLRGQIVGKAWMTLLAIAVLYVLRRANRRWVFA